MILLPPRATRTDTLFPYPTLFRSLAGGDGADTDMPGIEVDGVLVGMPGFDRHHQLGDGVVVARSNDVIAGGQDEFLLRRTGHGEDLDRKSTRLNSSH